jgi:AcrR family transcriptional regulator
MTASIAPRPAGRPRRAATGAAILRAAIELVAEVGVAGTTLTAVAERAGVARATVYLRWPTRSALIGAAARAAVGGQPLPITGDIVRDIRFATAYIGRVFGDPAFRAVFPEIVRGVLANPPEVSFDSVAPRRREFGRIYHEQAAASGLDPDVNPYVAFDMLLGTAIAYLLANGRPMTETESAAIGEVILRGLRRPATEAGA